MIEEVNRRLSVDEIGKCLGVSSDTIYRWIEKHAMPAHHMGAPWKFKQDEIDEWLRLAKLPNTIKGILIKNEQR